MKLTQKLLREMVKDVLNEQPPAPPKKDDSGGEGGEGETSKELKIDIPDTPFKPDINQVVDKLKNILKQWEIKEYPSDAIRWKEYYKDIAMLLKKIQGEN